MKKLKVLNLYSGIGGNRKNWGDNDEITAVELDPNIAKIYQDFFPEDKVIVADAHQYLLENFENFDFIWSSPPCPSHSQLRKHLSMASGSKPIYPDMKLYEEILLLQGYFKGKYVVENVISWYDPLVEPQTIQRHYFWANFIIHPTQFEKDNIKITNKQLKEKEAIEILQQSHNINLDGYNIKNKRLLLRNCVNPKVGLHIFQEAYREKPRLF